MEMFTCNIKLYNEIFVYGYFNWCFKVWTRFLVFFFFFTYIKSNLRFDYNLVISFELIYMIESKLEYKIP